MLRFESYFLPSCVSLFTKIGSLKVLIQFKTKEGEGYFKPKLLLPLNLLRTLSEWALWLRDLSASYFIDIGSNIFRRISFWIKDQLMLWRK